MAKKGEVAILESHGTLQLRFRLGDKRQKFALGLPDTPNNRKVAQMIARQIELDIASGHFDHSLAKYRLRGEKATPQAKSTPDLKQLWQGYEDYKRPQVSQSTLAKDFRRWQGIIERLPTVAIDGAVPIRDWALLNLSPNTAKRLLTQLCACCDWAVKSGKIADNPFKGMAAGVKTASSRREETEIDPFTAEERDRVIAAFENNFHYRHYAPLVKFLFWTGCRPSEALALQWQHVDPKSIRFEQGLTVSEGGLAIKDGLKTQQRRVLPVNARLIALLDSIRPENPAGQELIFPAPRGGYIDFHNFRNRAWAEILKACGLRYRKPYQTRHTFITLALEHGMEAKDVAKLVGNSPEVIYRHYAGAKKKLELPEV